MKIILMRGTRNFLVREVSEEFEDADAIVLNQKPYLKRRDVFDYSHTTKRGRVFRERKINKSSAIVF